MASPGPSTFSIPDFVVLLVYLVGIVSIGSFFYR